jgi:hypothetical protein
MKSVVELGDADSKGGIRDLSPVYMKSVVEFGDTDGKERRGSFGDTDGKEGAHSLTLVTKVA